MYLPASATVDDYLNFVRRESSMTVAFTLHTTVTDIGQIRTIVRQGKTGRCIGFPYLVISSIGGVFWSPKSGH